MFALSGSQSITEPKRGDRGERSWPAVGGTVEPLTAGVGHPDSTITFQADIEINVRIYKIRSSGN